LTPGQGPAAELPSAEAVREWASEKRAFIFKRDGGIARRAAELGIGGPSHRLPEAIALAGCE
jgi:hypothetical protein